MSRKAVIPWGGLVPGSFQGVARASGGRGFRCVFWLLLGLCRNVGAIYESLRWDGVVYGAALEFTLRLTPLLRRA